jgi:hypothetical protein
MTDAFDIGNLDHDDFDGEALCQDALRTPQLLPPPSMPMDVARVFVEKACFADGLLTLSMARRISSEVAPQNSPVWRAGISRWVERRLPCWAAFRDVLVWTG